MNTAHLKLCSKTTTKAPSINKSRDNRPIESEANVKFLGLFFGLTPWISKANNEKALNGLLSIYIL